MVDRLIDKVARHQRSLNGDVLLLYTVIACRAFQKINGAQAVSLGLALVFVELVI